MLGTEDNLHNVVDILNQFLEILRLKLDWEKNVAQKASQASLGWQTEMEMDLRKKILEASRYSL